jgi:hypothetical protein
MVIYDRNGVPAVLKWRGGWYEPAGCPTGFLQWIKDNPHLKDRVKDRPKVWKQLGIW